MTTSTAKPTGALPDTLMTQTAKSPTGAGTGGLPFTVLRTHRPDGIAGIVATGGTLSSEPDIGGRLARVPVGAGATIVS